MQTPDGRVRVPGALGAVTREDVGQTLSVFREVRQGDGAILDERDRFSGLLHRHHHVEAGLAVLCDRALQAVVGDRDDAAPSAPRAGEGETHIAHQLRKLAELGRVSFCAALREFDQQQSRGLSLDKGLDGLAEQRDIAPEGDHRIVDPGG